MRPPKWNTNEHRVWVHMKMSQEDAREEFVTALSKAKTANEILAILHAKYEQGSRDLDYELAARDHPMTCVISQEDRLNSDLWHNLANVKDGMIALLTWPGKEIFVNSLKTGYSRWSVPHLYVPYPLKTVAKIHNREWNDAQVFDDYHKNFKRVRRQLRRKFQFTREWDERQACRLFMYFHMFFLHR